MTLDAHEADAVLAILEKRRSGATIVESDWARLFATAGYRDLQRRELAMQRAFTDSAFRAFVMSDSLLHRSQPLGVAVARMKQLDPRAAAARALAYLPPTARIQAVLYPEIKPKTNSFVFGLDSVVGIFLYVDPQVTPPKLENTLAHELHHIGFASACEDAALPATEPMRTLVTRLGGFSEGLAMLAAAGGANVHPHAVSDSASRARWDNDIRNVQTQFAAVEGLIRSVVEQRVTSPDSIVAEAMTLYGEQGPWYTVGWTMGVTIERAFGRQRLIESMCDPRLLMRSYNEAVTARGDALPRWPAELVRLLDGAG